jgi:alpha-tubulin suppressor-like RCC1 family protein
MKRVDIIDPNIKDPKSKTLLDIIKDSADPNSTGLNRMDYISLQLSAESLVYKKMFSDDSTINSYVYDKHENQTYGLWLNNSSSLKSVFTQSNQTNDSFFKNVFVDSDSTSSIQFSIACGDYSGIYYTTKSISNSNTQMLESKLIYSQYNNLLNEQKKLKFLFNYPSWEKSISTGSRIYVAGTNASGSFGNSTETDLYYSMKLDDYEMMDSGYNYFAALKKDGTIVTWGDNTYGKIAQGSISSSYYPTEISYSKSWKMLSCGPEHTLAIKKDGTLWSWGRNNYGQLGDGTLTDSNEPILIDSDEWNFVSAGNRFSCAIKPDGTLWTWGDNLRGQLGNNNPGTNNIVPAQALGENWEKIYTSCQTGSDGFAVGMLNDGSIWGFGSNDQYQLGLDDTTDRYTPTLIDSDEWKMISVGSAHCLGIKTSGEMYGWGYNINNPLGELSSATITTPTKNSLDGDNWSFLDTSIENSMGIKTNNVVYKWGNSSLLAPQIFLLDYKPYEEKYTNHAGRYVSVSDFYDEISDMVQHYQLSFLAEYDLFEIDYTDSNNIYCINVDSSNLRDGIEPGMWQLALKSVDKDTNVIEEPNPITLIDDSILYDKRIDRKDVYNIYSGSISNGLYTGSYSVPYGLFYPNNGIIVLNGKSLHSFASIIIDEESERPIDKIYTAISGAIQTDSELYPFKATSFERAEHIYAFVRILSDEFNYTNNPSYTTGQSSFVRKDITKNSNGISYITTIGLYDDNRDLIAVAKLSKPIRKTPDTELVVKVRIKN